jgi:hypothetical protein
MRLYEMKTTILLPVMTLLLVFPSMITAIIRNILVLHLYYQSLKEKEIDF